MLRRPFWIVLLRRATQLLRTKQSESSEETLLAWSLRTVCALQMPSATGTQVFQSMYVTGHRSRLLRSYCHARSPNGQAGDLVRRPRLSRLSQLGGRRKRCPASRMTWELFFTRYYKLFL